MEGRVNGGQAAAERIQEVATAEGAARAEASRKDGELADLRRRLAEAQGVLSVQSSRQVCSDFVIPIPQGFFTHCSLAVQKREQESGRNRKGNRISAVQNGQQDFGRTEG